MNIGKNIKYYRKKLNIDQKELAIKLCVSDKTISSWECGRTEPKMGMVEMLADVFGITKSDLLGGDTEQPTYPPQIRDFISRMENLPPKYKEDLFRYLKLLEMEYENEKSKRGVSIS